MVVNSFAVKRRLAPIKPAFCLLPLLLASSTLLPVFAQNAEPRIENRTPEPDEIGYLPAHNSTTTFNPPSLTWLHEKAAHLYEVQWSRDEKFSAPQTQSKLPFNVYTHNAPLATGKYFWRYRFADKEGALSNWSQIRAFTIPPNATEFPMPDRAQQMERVPKSHPRLFLRPEDLPGLRELSVGREKARFEKLRESAEKIMAGAPDPEPDVMGRPHDPKTRHAWWPNRERAQKVSTEAETLAFVYLITQEEKYGAAARRWIMHLAAWNPDGPTDFNVNCEAAKPMLHRLPRAYDWAYDALSEADRNIVRAVMKHRALDAWNSGEVGRGVGHLNKPQSSHGNRTFHKLGECAIAFLGEIPEATDWLDYAVNKFFAAYPVWADNDGGWHEGVAYWNSYLSKVVWWLQVQKSALGVDGMKKPFFSQVGDFVMYVAPPNSPNSGFGDQSHNKISTGLGSTMEFYQRAAKALPTKNNAAYWRSWSQNWGMSGAGGVLGFLYAANLGPLPEAKALTDLPQSKVFNGIGVASLHSNLLDARDDVHFLFKSSPFGNKSHGFNAQNSFQLNAYGEELLPAITYRDRYGSPFHYQWDHETKSQNAVLVDGVGQVVRIAGAWGRISEENLTPKFDYVAGDATPAYQGRLQRFHRRVLFLKPDIIVIYDDIEATEPATFQWMLHAPVPFDVYEEREEKRLKLLVNQPKAGVEVRYLPAQTLAVRQWDGYDPAPEKKFPNQWHVEAGTTTKQESIGMLTVLLPYRTGQSLHWTAERLESDSAIGVKLNNDKSPASTLIAFSKHGVKGAATLDNWKFEGRAAVK